MEQVFKKLTDPIIDHYQLLLAVVTGEVHWPKKKCGGTYTKIYIN